MGPLRRMPPLPYKDKCHYGFRYNHALRYYCHHRLAAPQPLDFLHLNASPSLYDQDPIQQMETTRSKDLRAQWTIDLSLPFRTISFGIYITATMR